MVLWALCCFDSLRMLQLPSPHICYCARWLLRLACVVAVDRVQSPCTAIACVPPTHGHTRLVGKVLSSKTWFVWWLQPDYAHWHQPSTWHNHIAIGHEPKSEPLDRRESTAAAPLSPASSICTHMHCWSPGSQTVRLAISLLPSLHSQPIAFLNHCLTPHVTLYTIKY